MENNDGQPLSVKLAEEKISGSLTNQASPYITAESLFDTQQYGPDFLNMADPAGLLNVDRYTQDMFKYGPEVLANLTAPDPGIVDIGYNPSKPRLEDLSITDQIKNWTPTENPLEPLPTIYGNIKEMGFDRAYAHPKFNELGFTPYADTESYYNANSSKLDDLTRAYNQFGSQFGTGLTAAWNSIADMFDGDGYIDSPDLEGAYAMEDAMRIGSTSRGGAFGTLTNVGLSFGYTAGIITSIAIEELILAGGSAALASTGVGAPAGAGTFIAGTGRNLFRTGRAISNLFDIKRYGSASRALVKTLNNVNNARQLARGGLEVGGKIFAPEVTYAIKNWKTTGNTAQNIMSFMKSGENWVSAYRDFRQVNLALAEGKLEAGMVENRVRENQLRYLAQENPGEQVTADQLADIEVKSREAAFRSQMQNTAIIYFTNKLLLRSAFGGWRRAASKNVTDKIFRTNPLRDAVTGKALKGIYRQQSKWLLPALGQKIAAAGFRGAPRVFAGAMLRYGAGGIGEGIQEVTQEAIAATNEGYYGALLREPGSGAKHLYGSFAMDGVKDQFSAQGFETFLSGFLMGGMAGPYQQVLFQGFPYLYSRRSKNSRSDYDSQKQAEQEVINRAVDQANQMSPGYNGSEASTIDVILDETQLMASLQKNALDGQNEALSAGDKYNFYNQRNFAQFANIYDKYQRGTISLYEEELNGYSQLTDEELAQAFPKKDYGSTQKVREKILKQKELIQEYGEMFDNRNNPFKKRYEPKLFKPGTRQYRDEVAMKKAYKHMEMFSMFTQNAFKDAVERKGKIAQALESVPLFGKMSANDISPLLDKESLETELDRLDQEIEAIEANLQNESGLSELDKKRNKKNLKDKKARRKQLLKISKVYNANLTDKGYYDRRKKKNLEASVKSYLKTLANANGTFVDNDAAQNAINEIIDYATLSQDSYMFNQTIEYLLDPNKMEGLIERSAEYFKQVGAARNSLIKGQIKDLILNENQNKLLNELAKEDIYLDPTETREFLETGNINLLKTFIYAGRQLDPAVIEDLEIIMKIVNPILDVYIQTTTPVQEETAADVVDESVQEVKDTLDEAGIQQIVLKDSYQSPLLQKILDKQFREYQANTFGEDLMDFSKWKEGPEGLNIKEGYDAIKRIWASGYQRFSPEGQIITFKPNQTEIDDEVGFQDFINNYADDSPTVRDVLQELEVNLSIYKTVKSAPASNIIQDGLIVDLQKRVLDPTNEDETTTYVLLDKNGNLINNRMKQIIGSNASGTFTDIRNAQDAFELLEREGSDGTTFKFGGLVLSKGERIVDEAGNVFRVNTNAAGNQKNPSIIYLVPEAEYSQTRWWSNSEAAREFGAVKEEDFIGRYRVMEEIKVPELGNNFAKLPPDETIKAWPHTNAGETRDQANDRLEMIMSNLTPQEIQELNIFIKPSVANTNTYSYQVPGEANQLEKLPNPYIINKGNDYTIGIQMVDPVVITKMNALLGQAEGINLLEESANGIFAYFPSNQFEFVDGNGVIIDPASMDANFMNSTMYLEGIEYKGNTEKENLEIVRRAFATGQALQAAVQKEIGETPTGDIKVGRLPDGLSITIFQGFPNYTKPSAFTEVGKLPFGADGTGNAFLVLDVDPLSLLPTPITNLEGDAEIELISQVEAGLKKQGLMNEDGSLKNVSNRYNVVVKDPSGLYTVGTSTVKEQPVADLDVILNDYINMAQKVLETNVTKKGQKTEVKDQNIATEFNKQQRDKLFITSDVKGRQFYLEVTPYGSISLKAKDKVTGPKAQLTGVQKYEQLGKTAYLYNQDFSRDDRGDAEINSTVIFQKLVDKINAQFDEPIISLKNFKVSIAENAPLEDFLVNLETALNPNQLRKGQKILINVEAKVGQSQRDKGVIIQTPISTPQATAEALERLQDKVEVAEVVEKEVLEEGKQLTKVLEQIKNLKEEISSKVEPKDRRKAFKENKKLQALYKKRDELRGANKIIDGPLLQNDIEDIAVFTEWAQTNLPEFINVEDISVLGSNLLTNGRRVGAFVIDINDLAGGLDVKGTIYTGANSPFRYHEAFHGVYRMLLTPAEQARYLRIARKEKRAELRKEGKSFETELQRFRNSADIYQNMGRERLEREYFEEYLADQFELFKTDPRNTKTESVVKSLFTRIIEFIKAILNGFRRNQLNTLFENIDSGKYQSAPMTTNEFTTLGATIEANKLIPYAIESKEEGVGDLYIPSIIAEPIISSMAGILIERKFNFVPSEEKPAFNLDEELDIIVDEFAELYNVDSVANKKYKADSKERKTLDLLTQAFEDFIPQIKESVNKMIEIINLQSAQQEANNEFFLQNEGVRNISQYGKEAYMTGGFDNLSNRLRQYISTVTMPATDYFGNTELADGTPFVQPVNANQVYNGLLKSLQGLSDPLAMIQKMQLFADTNPQTKAVVESIFESAGLVPLTEEGEVINELPQQLKNPDFLNKVLKAFTNFRVEWYFQQRDNLGNTIIHSASQRDDASTQLDNWSEAYTNKLQVWAEDPREKSKALKSLIKLKNKLRLKDQKVRNKTLNKEASELSQELFEAVGIRVSPGYMRYSLLKSRNNHYNDQIVELGFYPNAEGIVYEDINVFQSLINNGQDIFDRTNEGASSRLKRIALNNATFDETIGATVFRNSNGDLVNSHQVPTYHLTKTKELNSAQERNKLKNDPFLSNNYLLNSQAFNNLADNNQIKISRVSGTKVLDQLSTELDSSMSNALKTMDYGKYTPGEFMTSNINLYLANLNYITNRLSSYVMVKDEVSGIETQVAISPMLNRVIESSNTGDLTTLAVIKAVSKVNGKDVITDEALDIFYNFVKNEYDRIRRESLADPLTYNKVGYNLQDTNNPEAPLRAFTFSNNATLLDSATKIALEGEAVSTNAVSFEQALKNSNLSVAQFKTQLRKKLGEQYKLFNDLIDANNIRDKIDKRIRRGLNPNNEAAQLSQSQYNLRNNDEQFNLKQIFLSNYANVKSLNELLLGDQAITLKSFTDKGKRAKGQNGSGLTAYSPFTNPQQGINHATDKINLITLSEPQGVSAFSNDSIDKADAQMWMTTKAFRHFWFGFGLLSNAQAAVLDKIEAGEKIEWGEISNLVNEGGMINSKKLVYFDGDTFIKMSAFVLTPELTSMKNSDGVLVAKPNSLPLHNLRVRLEALEEGTESVSIAAPLSALKMLQQNVVAYQELNMTEQGFSQESTPLSAKNMRLQQISPSNKRKITELSQMKTLITNEQSPKSAKQIKRYNELVAERHKFKYINKRNLTFNIPQVQAEAQEFLSATDKKITPNLILFSQYAVTSLQASQNNSNLIEFFSLDQFNQPKYDLNNPYTVAKFEQLFLTYFSQDVFQEKIAGTSFALASSFGKKIYRRVYSVDKTGQPDKQEVIRENIAHKDNIAIDPRMASDLVGVKIPKEGIVILDRLRYNLKEYDQNGKWTGQRYSEALIPAQFKATYELIEGDNKEMPTMISDMFSVRIPSQDKHSAQSVKAVDFLPVFYGSSAMFSDELVEVSGADFDIDVAYTQRKDFYVKDGKFIEYGNNYADYVNYVNKEVNEPGSIYKSAIRLFDIQGSLVADSLTDIEDTRAEEAGFSREAVKALQGLGLPITKQQFNDYINKKGVPPYVAPLNNEILDLRRSLVSNEKMTSGNNPVAYTPASLDLIRQGWEDISGLAPSLKSREIAGEQDIDNLAGQTISFTNNKGASIGSVVSPNLYLSLLVEYEIKIGDAKFALDNKLYDTFAGADTTDGTRKQDIISSIVTMMTDNAKEYFVAKLGLNSHAAGMLTNMIALGVPLDTSLLLLNNEFIQEQYKAIDNSDSDFTLGITKRVRMEIDRLNKPNKKLTAIPPTKDILIGGVENYADLSAGQQKGIMETFLDINRIRSFTSKLNSVLSLNNGLGKDFNRIDSRLDDIADMSFREYETNPLQLTKPLFNLESIFENTYLGTLRNTFLELTNKLLPNVFITRTLGFRKMEKQLQVNLNPQLLAYNPDVVSKVKKDLLGYVTINDYIQNKLNNDSLSIGTLSNDLIYPNKSDLNVINAVKKLREVDPGNFFLESFITTLPAQARQNFSGINLVRANTWRKLNRLQMSDLQTSFNKLYNDLNTRGYAKQLIDYVFVKDGLQLSPGSILEALSPYVLEDYLSHIPTVRVKLEEDKITGSFVVEYLSMASNQNLLAIKKPKDDVKDMPIIYKEFGPTDPVTGERKAITFTSNPQGEASPIDLKGSPLQNGIGFIFGPVPLTEDLKKVEAAKPTLEDVQKESQGSFENAIAKEMQERGLNNPSFNKVYDGENLVVETPDGSKVNIDDVDGLAKMEAEFSKATEELGIEEVGIIDDTNLPPISEEVQLKIDLLEESDPAVSQPELTQFWNDNIENGEFSEQVELFKQQNDINTLEDLVDLYDNNPNSFWSSPQGMIEQIKRCNL